MNRLSIGEIPIYSQLTLSDGRARLNISVRGVAMIRSFAASLIALVMMGGFAASVSAGPISGTLSGDATLTPTAALGVFTQNYSGDGNDTMFGSYTVQSTSTVDFSHPPNVVISDGTFTETFSEGTLFGTSSGNGTASGMEPRRLQPTWCSPVEQGFSRAPQGKPLVCRCSSEPAQQQCRGPEPMSGHYPSSWNQVRLRFSLRRHFFCSIGADAGRWPVNPSNATQPPRHRRRPG